MENKSPSIIAIDAGVAIILVLTIEYLEGKGQQSMQSPAPATGTWEVEGPSLSATHRNAILTNTESPAVGSQLYGIDDASALASDDNYESSHSAAVESDVNAGRAV
jgi:hypothetical protein